MSKTDTLDAIARDMRNALRCNDYESDWIKDWAARIEAITALSNQGEGAVVGAYWDTLNDCPMLGRDLESPRFQPLFRGAGDGRRDSYKHGWINSALWAGRNDLISDIDSPAYIKARDEVLGKLATEAEADRRDAEREALAEYLKAQDALDNHEAGGINADDYFALVRARNAARRDLDAATQEQT